MSRKGKRLLRALGMIAGLVGGAMALGFAERSAGDRTITAVEVHLARADGVHFLDETAVERVVLDQGTAVLGAPALAIDLAAMEDRLRALPAVAEADAYRTMDGVLHVQVRQRVPIVRVFNRDGSDFYIDSEGWAMPSGHAWSPRVPVVTGALHETGARIGVRHALVPDSHSVHSAAIHRLAAFIHADPLWRALVDQVVIDARGGYEIVPTMGPARIVLGPADQWPDEAALRHRFDKLKLFYEQGVPQAGWRRYARIDLRFGKQVVCTQRAQP
ncbi:MAG: hypothetical protein RBT71_09875 [Flavobacteriales bacterium]|jgi:cell division protein FtsQ|nr:hypothetical protein [Flavobacteriales bacterium]